jgi:hypothetical protein
MIVTVYGEAGILHKGRHKMKARYVIIALAMIIVLFSSATYADTKGTLKTYRGRVIYLTDEFCEMKWDRGELTFYFSPNTKYYVRGGAEGSKGSIRLCQVLRVWYRMEKGKRVLSRVRILREGSCR